MFKCGLAKPGDKPSYAKQRFDSESRGAGH